MKKTRAYLAPEIEVRKSLIRASILAGSGNDGTAFNGVQDVPVTNPPSMPIEARKRNNIVEY